MFLLLLVFLPLYSCSVSYFNIILSDVCAAASCSLGAAQASLEQACDHLKVRKQFGSALASFQVCLT